MASPGPPVSQYQSFAFPRSAIPSVIGAWGGIAVISPLSASPVCGGGVTPVVEHATRPARTMIPKRAMPRSALDAIIRILRYVVGPNVRVERRAATDTG